MSKIFFFSPRFLKLMKNQKKEFVENKDSNGTEPDEKVANEAWSRHLKRNDSVVVDLFQGQYKSRVQCPKCSKISVTFDPFMYLSVPIPVTVKKFLFHFFFPISKKFFFFLKKKFYFSFYFFFSIKNNLIKK